MHLNPLQALPLALGCSLFAQSHLVVPAAYTNTDAISYEWIAGASRDLRQQTLIGQNHLQALVGHTLTALELRRTSADEVYLGGATDLTVTLSISPNAPLSCSQEFTANVGPVAAIPEIEELNIGHHVVSRAVFVGLDAAIRELRAAMDAARRRP